MKVHVHDIIILLGSLMFATGQPATETIIETIPIPDSIAPTATSMSSSSSGRHSYGNKRRGCQVRAMTIVDPEPECPFEPEPESESEHMVPVVISSHKPATPTVTLDLETVVETKQVTVVMSNDSGSSTGQNGATHSVTTITSVVTECSKSSSSSKNTMTSTSTLSGSSSISTSSTSKLATTVTRNFTITATPNTSPLPSLTASSSLPANSSTSQTTSSHATFTSVVANTTVKPTTITITPTAAAMTPLTTTVGSSLGPSHSVLPHNCSLMAMAPILPCPSTVPEETHVANSCQIPEDTCCISALPEYSMAASSIPQECSTAEQQTQDSCDPLSAPLCPSLKATSTLSTGACVSSSHPVPSHTLLSDSELDRLFPDYFAPNDANLRTGSNALDLQVLVYISGLLWSIL